MRMQCIQCGDEFESLRSDQSCCSKRCRSKLGKEAVYGARRDYLRRLKISSGCVICGYSDHASALTFDHIDPKNKQYEMASIYRRPMKIIMSELEKCRVLCANCHSVHSFNQRQA